MADAREIGLEAVRVREVAINHLIMSMFGGDAKDHPEEHETMAAYIDALIDDPFVLRQLADTFAPPGQPTP